VILTARSEKEQMNGTGMERAFRVFREMASLEYFRRVFPAEDTALLRPCEIDKDREIDKVNHPVDGFDNAFLLPDGIWNILHLYICFRFRHCLCLSFCPGTGAGAKLILFSRDRPNESPSKKISKTIFAIVARARGAIPTNHV